MEEWLVEATVVVVAVAVATAPLQEVDVKSTSPTFVSSSGFILSYQGLQVDFIV
jgi:hypothetical protein